MNRCAPMISSNPMVASHRPMHPDNRPVTTELESSDPITVTPKIASQNNSDGPNAKAHCANIGVRKINNKTPKTPPTAEDKNDNCNALAPWPFLAMVCPSKVVAILAGAPGIFSKIALTAPPATVDVYAAPNRINPCAGSNLNVNGINRATAIVGDNPGVAPSIKPPIVPTSNNMKLNGVNTSPKYIKNSTLLSLLIYLP